MYCKRCGKKLSTEDRFCSFCGSPVEKSEIIEPTMDDFQMAEETAETYKRVNSLQKDCFEEEWEKEERREKFTFLIFGVLIVVLIMIIAGGIFVMIKKEKEKLFLDSAASDGEWKIELQESQKEGDISGNQEVIITPQLILPNENSIGNDLVNEIGEGVEKPNDGLENGNRIEFIIFDSDVRYLVSADLNGLTAWEIRVARNEIFARHGRMFDSLELKKYFESKSWYVPTVPAVEFNNSCLSIVEMENLNFIINYEKAHNLN